MTNEEAKRILLSDADFSGAGEKAKVTADALCRAIDALEKQIPKKARVGHGFKDVCFCQSCGHPVCQWQFGDLVNYCFYCGNALGWSEDNDE